MSQSPILFIVVMTFSLGVAGCCASHPAPMHETPAIPPSIVSSPPNDLLLISAAYGSGVSFADVTLRVDALLHQPHVVFYARPEWMNADPTPGWNKALVIEYEYLGHRHIFTTGEGGKVSAEQLINHATSKTKRKHRNN